jgi:serine/threonine protein kinase
MMEKGFATSVPPAPPTAARVSNLGKYRMIADLGRGGMSEVYLAVSQGMAGFQKLRVIKLLRQDLGRDSHFVQMFLDEARLAARLSHPNVVQTNEVGEVDNRYFIDMEYIEGQSLSTIMKRLWRKRERMAPALAARIVADALAGLHYAHEFAAFDGTRLNIVHRDVSPHNMIVRYDGVVVVVDFGIAKASTQSVATETGVIKGKVAYMAPEQAAGSPSADARADIFSVGVILHEQLTGQRFWSTKTDLEILHALYRGDVPASPRSVDPTVPEALDAIVKKATAAQASERYASAAEMIRDLEAYLEASTDKASHRDVSQFVSSMYEEERKTLRSLIDAQLKSLEAGNAASLLELSSTITADFGMSRSGASFTGTPSGAIDISGLGTAGGSRATGAGSTGPGRRYVLPLGVIALALAVGGVILARRSAPMATTPAALAASPPAPQRVPEVAAPPVGAGAEKPKIRMLVTADPPQARLFLDDAELPRNPYVEAVAADPAVHRLRAECPGYSPRTVAVTFNTDVDLTLRLDKVADARRPTHGRGKDVAPAKEPAPTPAPLTKPAEPASRPKAPSLDETNPFR